MKFRKNLRRVGRWFKKIVAERSKPMNKGVLAISIIVALASALRVFSFALALSVFGTLGIILAAGIACIISIVTFITFTVFLYLLCFVVAFFVEYDMEGVQREPENLPK